MRYMFIVHEERVASFGKQRAKTVFHCILGFVPIFTTIWLYFGAADRDIDLSPAINKCNGNYDKIFHLKQSFTEPQSVWDARCSRKNNSEGPTSAIELLQYIQCINVVQ